MTKLHIILNSHLDPVWLWDKSAGIDEVIATARTACDMLDDYPEIFITRGEAWFYDILEACAPEVYARVKAHVASGRWQVVGNWYIQPDCNLPSADAFRWQAEISRPTFEKLGVKPSVGYNVDSFGHAATLPDFYRACGVDSYIMRRPGAHEMKLPANIFKWVSPNGNSITVGRIFSYNTTGRLTNIERNISAELAAATPGVGHALCMVGAGDHGGGPTRKEIEYILAHRQWSDDVELVFSHPRAFFDAVAASGAELPVVATELQQHAIGCYTAMHDIKQNHRRAEALIAQAENLLARHRADAPADAEATLVKAKKILLFNEFHDLLGGCSTRRAMTASLAELGGAWSSAKELIDYTLHRAESRAAKPDELQRAVFCNLSKRDHKGLVEFNPWLGYYPPVTMRPNLEFLDEAGDPIAWQSLPGESASLRSHKIALALDIPAGGRRVVRIKYSPDGAQLHGTSPKGAEKPVKAAVRALRAKLAILDDPSDTWSHDMTRYKGKAKYSQSLGVGKFRPIANGGLLQVATWKWSCPAGEFELEARVCLHEPNATRCKLRVYWNGRQELAKLCFAPPFQVAAVRAGAPGGIIDRAADGRELPFFDFVSLAGRNGEAFTVVSRDVYGCDVTKRGALRLTLLRSPYYANHNPRVVEDEADIPVCDRGTHEFEFTVFMGVPFDAEAVADEVNRQSSPIHFTESTLGCARQYLVPHVDLP